MDKKRVLCFGDSNTYGFDPVTRSRYDDAHRWPAVLQQLIGESYEVISEGLPGRTSDFANPGEEMIHGFHYFRPCVFSHLPIDTLILMLGTNDCTYTTDPAAVAAGIRKIAFMATRAPIWSDKKNKKILLVCPCAINRGLPTAEGDEALDAQIRCSVQLSESLKQLAEGLKIEFFDANTVARVGGIADQLHLDPESHVSLGKALAEKFLEMHKEQ